MFQPYDIALPTFSILADKGYSRLALNVAIDFILFILIGAAFRMSITETFLMIPAIVNAGMLLSVQGFPCRITWREEPGSPDVERQNAIEVAQPAPSPHVESQPGN
jgi:hypothetical protein